MASHAPGDDIDAHCDECESVMEHVIVVVRGKRPDRVECKKCGATHAYRAARPTPRRRSSGVDKIKAPAQDIPNYDKLMKGRNLSQAVTYKMSTRFNEKDVIDHKVFGIGLVTRVLNDDKIEVVFPTGLKILVHDR